MVVSKRKFIRIEGKEDKRILLLLLIGHLLGRLCEVREKGEERQG